MEEQTQQAYLKAVKTELGVEWDELAERAGIKPRALKTYRMPATSKDFRTMPSLAHDALERLLQDHRKRMGKSLKGA
ncbi:hypothetical protein [Chromobacterium haemolyticum]|uniref:hypothetical protein n=1 Tax=Chromobacterium haemolyticum TaxID=394935 RepID=UPI002448FE08|nr:hypothetical protein [Chromobacterium haemolyticum]MDH0342046.1 hypothetical protein [Chromobacterium haemolyticum]